MLTSILSFWRATSTDCWAAHVRQNTPIANIHLLILFGMTRFRLFPAPQKARDIGRAAGGWHLRPQLLALWPGRSLTCAPAGTMRWPDESACMTYALPGWARSRLLSSGCARNR